MQKKKNKAKDNSENIEKEVKRRIIRRKSIKEMIAPTGIDASSLDHLEIIACTNRFARSFFVANLPRMCTFPELFRGMYMFGDINTSVYINPILESTSQNDLNRTINELETERIMAEDRGNINRARLLAQKRMETEELRDEIASGFNKMYQATIIATLFAYDLKTLDTYTRLLSTEMAKSLVDIKSAWATQEEAFQSNLPLMKEKTGEKHLFDRGSMGTVFPFVSSEVGHSTGIPLGYNLQTGVPILFDNFHESLTNYNMVIFAKSGAGKSVAMKTLISRSEVLMGI